MTDQVYISFREKGAENWHLLRITDPETYIMSCSANADPCAVDSNQASFYLEQLTKAGYETAVIQLEPRTKGIYLLTEQESLYDLLKDVNLRPKVDDDGYTGDLHPPRK